MPYSSMLFAADLATLASRRDDIYRKFFRNITKSTSCLNQSPTGPKDGIPEFYAEIIRIPKILHTYKTILFIYTVCT